MTEAQLGLPTARPDMGAEFSDEVERYLKHVKDATHIDKSELIDWLLARRSDAKAISLAFDEYARVLK